MALDAWRWYRYPRAQSGLQILASGSMTSHVERLTLNTRETAQLLGVSAEKFRLMRKDKNFPIKPLPYCKSRYYKKAIEQYLDNATNIKPDSTDWDSVFLKRLENNGDIQNEIRR